MLLPMPVRLLFVLLSLAVLSPALSCRQSSSANVSGNQAVAPALPAATMTPPLRQLFYGTGIVRGTNPKFPSVELDHDEIKGLMPAMQMEFYVSDQSLLQGLKPGMKVDFTLEDKGGAEMIIAIKKH